MIKRRHKKTVSLRKETGISEKRSVRIPLVDIKDDDDVDEAVEALLDGLGVPKKMHEERFNYVVKPVSETPARDRKERFTWKLEDLEISGTRLTREAGEFLDMEARELMKRHGISYGNAMRSVVAAHPDLAVEHLNSLRYSKQSYSDEIKAAMDDNLSLEKVVDA